MLKTHIQAVEVFAPAMPDWQAAQGVLQNVSAWQREPTPLPSPDFLSPREKRRISPSIALALAVAERLVRQAHADAKTLPVVFASALGETLVMDRILQALDTEERLVSPTQFHNSVHNSPTGYWMIGMEAMQPATSLAAGEDTVSAALLKAAMQAQAEQRPVLAVLYDVPMPSPLHEKYPLDYPFAAAFLLAPQPTPDSRATLTLTATQAPRPERVEGNPIAAALPLLALLAQQKAGEFRPGSTIWQVTPC